MILQLLPVPMMRLLQPSLWMKVYNVGAQRPRDKFDVTVTHGQKVTFNTALRLTAFLIASSELWVLSLVSCKREFPLDKFRYVYPCFVPFEKGFSTESAEWVHPWSSVQITFIAATLYSFSPFPFACGFQCTTHQLYVTRRKNLSKPNLYTQPTSLFPY
jgi:hypothetical protein